MARDYITCASRSTIRSPPPPRLRRLALPSLGVAAAVGDCRLLFRAIRRTGCASSARSFGPVRISGVSNALWKSGKSADSLPRHAMRQLVFQGPRRLSIEEAEPVPLGPAEVRIAVHSVGVCGSDVHGYAGVNARRVP